MKVLCMALNRPKVTRVTTKPRRQTDGKSRICGEDLDFLSRKKKLEQGQQYDRLILTDEKRLG